MSLIDPAIVEALTDALHADTDICGGGCKQTAKRLAPALTPLLRRAEAERDQLAATLTAAAEILDRWETNPRDYNGGRVLHDLRAVLGQRRDG